MTNGQRKA